MIASIIYFIVNQGISSSMGQDNKTILSNEQQLLKMFTIIDKIKEQNITYLQHLSDHKPFILREAIYNIEKEQQQNIAKIKSREHFNSPFLTNLVRFQTSKEQGLCSKYFRILSLWQFPRKTLAVENNQRALSRRPYTSQQIRVLLRHTAQGLLALQKQRIYHECLTTKSILVEQPLKFRVVDPICLPLHTNPQLIYHNRTLKNIYLSPEQCQMIDHQDISKTVADPFREDVFTAGMLILQSGLLQRQDDCYEEDCAKINWHQLEQNLNRFQEQYGPELRTILGLMLTQQTSKRIEWQQLIRILQNHNQPRLSNNVQRVSVIPHKIERVQGAPIIHHNLPLITRTGYSPIRSTLVRAPPPIIHNLSPGRIIRHISPNRVVHVQAQQKMKGSYIFNYQNNQQNVQRTSLPLNRTFHYQSRGLPINQLTTHNGRPVTYTTYQPAPAPAPINVAQNIQLSAKITRPTPQTYPETEHNQFKINSPTVLQKSQQKQLTSFELNQIEPVYVIQQFKNGSKFQGYKYKGKREGWGKYQYQEGGYYQGEWKNDLMSGKGKLYYQSGKIAYDGHLEQDLFHGLGTLYNELPEELSTPFEYRNFQQIEEFWIKYEGQFRNDKKQGHGLLLLTNGQSFEGSFHDDKVQGEGIYRTIQGREIRGIWHQNKLQRQL